MLLEDFIMSLPTITLLCHTYLLRVLTTTGLVLAWVASDIEWRCAIQNRVPTLRSCDNYAAISDEISDLNLLWNWGNQ